MNYLEVVRSQYLAALEMLKHAISTCPVFLGDRILLWDSGALRMMGLF